MLDKCSSSQETTGFKQQSKWHPSCDFIWCDFWSCFVEPINAVINSSDVKDTQFNFNINARSHGYCFLSKSSDHIMTHIKILLMDSLKWLRFVLSVKVNVSRKLGMEIGSTNFMREKIFIYLAACFYNFEILKFNKLRKGFVLALFNGCIW